MILHRQRLLFVLSSPSGAGKTTLARRLLERNSDTLEMSVSATTRPKRDDEMDGRDYSFVEPMTFALKRKQGEFLESAKVFDHYYGTPAQPVHKAWANGRDVLFDIDWQGAQQLKKHDSLREHVVSVFILPPSYRELQQRLFRRAKDSKEVIKARMAKAASEMSHYKEYDYVAINTELEHCVGEVEGILKAERTPPPTSCEPWGFCAGSFFAKLI